MPQATRKTKMISIRLSQEEYEFLKTVYESRGIRSVSEFARDAMNRIVTIHNSGHDQNDLADRMRVLDTRISVLQGEVSQLSRLVAHNLKKDN